MKNFYHYTKLIEDFKNSSAFSTHYLEFLKSLEHKPINGKLFCKQLGVQDCILRKMVAYARLHGLPVCSSGDGYWMGTVEDVKNTIEHLKSRYKSLEVIVDSLQRYVDSKSKRRLINRKRQPHETTL